MWFLLISFNQKLCFISILFFFYDCTKAYKIKHSSKECIFSIYKKVCILKNMLFLSRFWAYIVCVVKIVVLSVTLQHVIFWKAPPKKLHLVRNSPREIPIYSILGSGEYVLMSTSTTPNCEHLWGIPITTQWKLS